MRRMPIARRGPEVPIDILDLARTLYAAGAVPEALALAREVFAALVDQRRLLTLLPRWLKSLAKGQLPPVEKRRLEPGVKLVAGLLNRVGDRAEAVRGLTSVCGLFPDIGAEIASEALHQSQSRRVLPELVARPFSMVETAFAAPAVYSAVNSERTGESLIATPASIG